jgi:hypothetical protein
MLQLLSDKQKARLIVDVLFVVAIFLLPWWVILPALFVASFFFLYFVEFVLFVLLLDLLYGITEHTFFGHHLPVVLIALVVFVLIEPLKERLIWDTN